MTLVKLAIPLRRKLVPLVVLWAFSPAAAEVVLPPPGTDGWQPLELPRVKRKTVYTRVEVDGRAAVRADSECSASALAISLATVDLDRTPRLRWQWKIERGLSIANERTKKGDDFAARVYVMFHFEPQRASLWERALHQVRSQLYGQELPGNTISYVWTSGEPAGAAWDDPYTSVSRRVSRGRGQKTDWIEETVDVKASYMDLYGEEPPPLYGLAVMTDADNTCQSATAYYADFRFLGRADAQDKD